MSGPLENIKNYSILSKDIRYKTIIAFSLMSLLPILTFGWLVIAYVIPRIDMFEGLSLLNISFILVICIIVASLGFFLTKKYIVDPIVKIAGDIKVIAGGDTSRVVEVDTGDEIGEIGLSLNTMTQEIKDNIEKLKAYGEQTRRINTEINKKVLTLSSLLQTSNLISSGSELRKILSFVCSKISDIHQGPCVVMLPEPDREVFKFFSGSNLEKTAVMVYEVNKRDAPQEPVVIDSSTRETGLNKTALHLKEMLGTKNILLFPINSKTRYHGFLIAGNSEDGFVFGKDDQELMNIFVKQMLIAIENDLLAKKAKELAMTDEVTGLYNEQYITTRLGEEIKRACIYQRPCGFLLIDIDGFSTLHKELGDTKAKALLRAMGETLLSFINEAVDRVGRLDKDRFAIILPEKNKKESAALAETIRAGIEDGFYKIAGLPQKLTVTIGVSENPVDGSTAGELMECAAALVKKAKMVGKNRVEI